MTATLESLKKWAAAHLDALGVDCVFAPYIVGMLSDSDDALDDPDDVKFNIHQVLMGWLSPEDEDKAHEFVDDLTKFFANPALLTAATTAASVTSVTSDDDGVDDAFMHKIAESIISDDDDNDDNDPSQQRITSRLQTASGGMRLVQTHSSNTLGFDDIFAEDNELKADAPLFVPGTSSSKYTPPNSPGDDSDDDDLQDTGAYSYSSSYRHNDALADSGGRAAIDGNELISTDAYASDDEDGETTTTAADGAGDADSALADEESFFWSVAFELVGHLQLKFPDIAPTRIGDLLRLVALDANKAHAVLKATLEREAIGTVQVCRHYLAGDCRRADCMFLHETHAITCRFWLRGSCLQHDHCVFSHDFTEFYKLDDDALAQRDYDSEDDELDASAAQLNFDAEDMFPSLHTSASSANSTNSPSDSAAASSLAMNFARAVSLQPPAPNAFASNSSSGFGVTRRSQPPQPPSQQHRPLFHKDVYSNGRWVSTGADVASQYLALREEAYELACARNKCFMGATQAYRGGNKALAKSLSKQGHDLNARMKQCHFLAAQTIFESRNSTTQLYTERVMDLHGLHVAEAVEFLAHMLPKVADDGLESMYLVTGSGHHSKGPHGNARLLPAVEQFLVAEGYQFAPVADSRGYVGMLLVDLRW